LLRNKKSKLDRNTLPSPIRLTYTLSGLRPSAASLPIDSWFGLKEATGSTAAQAHHLRFLLSARFSDL
jgi:hypothetical protein